MQTTLKHIILIIMALIGQVGVAQQKDDVIPPNRKADIAMRQGNKQYNRASFADAEYQYRTSTALSDTNLDNTYNFGNALLQQKRYKEALERFQSVVNQSKDKDFKAKTYYNMGNAYMGLKDYQNAVTHYKESLKRNPNDEQARYNYAMAEQFLKDNPPQDNQDDKDQDKQNDKDKQDQNQDKDKQDKDKQNDKDQQNKDDNKQNNQDDKNQDKDGQNQDQKDQDKQNQDKQDNQGNEDQKDKDGQKDDKDPSDGQEPQDDNQQNQQGKTGKGKMSRQQIRQLLEALNNEEKKTQDKVNAKKVKGVPIKREKDW